MPCWPAGCYDTGDFVPTKPESTAYFLNDSDAKSRPGPAIIPRSEHNISRANISESALKVLYRLKKAGYGAFLVGGGVRDLLLGRQPKDFDLVTDAHPEQVRQLFRNCRLIGRRFRLAHVRFGREIVEVATFRATGDGAPEELRAQSDLGRLLRDNVYGTIDEDVWRRDFTVNALYYNIADFSVWDYAGGFEDVKRRRIRLIGDSLARYREDPVRMLRAVRFAAKLGFEIDPDTAAPIAEFRDHLREVPAARLFEEVLKLFQSGHAGQSFELLREYELFRYLFPATAEVLRGPDGEAAAHFIREGLASTDARIAEDKPVTPMYLYAVLLWPAVRALTAELEATGATPHEALVEACDRLVIEQQRCTSLPKRFGMPMKEMLVMQPRFTQRQGVRAQRMLEHKRFRAAFDFLVLRGRCGEVEQELCDFWAEVQDLPEAEQKDAFGGGRRRASKRRRRGKRRKRRNAAEQ